MRKGFGTLIEQRRLAAGLSPEQLAERIGRKSKSVVYRLEAEEQEPDSDTVNALVSALPLSAEELLKAMGVGLTPPAAARLPRRLVLALLRLPEDQLAHLTPLVERLADAGPLPLERPR